MTHKPIEYVKDGMVATVWLNRPQVANAYDLAMLRELRKATATAERDPGVRVVIIRGRGKNFCAGGDMAMLNSGHSWQELSMFAAKTLERIAESRRVTIAVVEGYAVGGGFELMLACDFAVASADARIGDLHIRNGLYPGAGTAYRLPRIVGIRKAKELMLSGDVLDGRTAKEWSLVNEVALAGELDELSTRFAARFSDKSPTVAWLTKTAVNRSFDANTQTLATLDHLASGLVGEIDDAKEGIAAFREKRPPVWKPLGPSLEAGFELDDDDANDEDE